MVGDKIPYARLGIPPGDKQSTDSSDRMPRPIKVVNADYPERLMKAGIRGTVLVRFYVDTNGRVVDPVAVKSPDPALSRLAEESLLKWRFTPGIKRGVPVNSLLEVPVTFADTGSGK